MRPRISRVRQWWLVLHVLTFVTVGELAGAESIVEALTAAHDDRIPELLAQPDFIKTPVTEDRPIAVRLTELSCAYANPASRYYRNPGVLARMQTHAAFLRKISSPSGLFDSGNLDSPPDSSFLIGTLMRGQELLLRDNHAASAGLRKTLGRIIRTTAAAIARGGVHTTNHRWDISATLAAVNARYPSPDLRACIDTWLAEVVDQDVDGQYGERSPAYSEKVMNPALIELAEYYDRPDLLDLVQHNLDLTFRLTNRDGALVTVASRRQDQHAGVRTGIAGFYWGARYIAIKRQDALSAGLVHWIEREFFEELLDRPKDPNWPLPLLLLHPEVAGTLPPGELPADFVAYWEKTGLARVRTGDTTATINGSSDWALGYGHASGLATNPTFFALEKGRAVLESVRLTPSFFTTGFFYANGLKRLDGKWRLEQEVAVPYYLPLAPQDRNRNGDYALTPDGRFFSKLDMPNRARQERKLRTEITIAQEDGAYVLDIAIDGQDGVGVTLELAFRNDGVLSGVEPSSADPLGHRPSQAWLLREGWGQFSVGDDVIEFGPGIYHAEPDRMWNGNVSWVGGRIAVVGQRVYLTGVTPFRHQLTIR